MKKVYIFLLKKLVKEIETLLTYKNLFFEVIFVLFVRNEAYQEIFSDGCRKKEKGDRMQVARAFTAIKNHIMLIASILH